MEMEPDKTQRRVYIQLPKQHMAGLAEHYELDHGLVIKNLNAYINEGYVQAYFREWGTITACKIQKDSSSGSPKGLAYVRFSSETEADKADWAGPHYIGGTEVEVKRVVSPKMEEAEEKVEIAPYIPRPRRSMGLGYILEDAQCCPPPEAAVSSGQPSAAPGGQVQVASPVFGQGTDLLRIIL